MLNYQFQKEHAVIGAVIIVAAIIVGVFYWPDSKGIACRVAGAGYIPLYEQSFLAIPKRDDEEGGIAFGKGHLVGAVIGAYDNLGIRDENEIECDGIGVVHRPIFTEESIVLDEVPTDVTEFTLSSTERNWVNLKGLEQRVGNVNISIDANLARSLTITNPKIVRLDFNSIEYLSLLSSEAFEDQKKHGYLIEEALVSDYIYERGASGEVGFGLAGVQSAANGAEFDFRNNYDAIAVMLGVKLKRISIARWSLRDKMRSQDGTKASNDFSTMYEVVAHGDKFETSYDFFVVREEADGRISVRFRSPVYSSQGKKFKGVDLDDIDQENDIVYLDPGSGFHTVWFFDSSQNHLFTYRLVIDVKDDGAWETDDGLSAAQLLRWEAVSLEGLINYREQWRRDEAFLRLQQLRMAFHDEAILTNSRENGETYVVRGSLNQDYNPTKNVSLETVAELQAAIEEADLYPDPTDDEKNKIDRAKSAIEIYNDRGGPTNAELQEIIKSNEYSSGELEDGSYQKAIFNIQLGKYEEAHDNLLYSILGAQTQVGLSALESDTLKSEYSQRQVRFYSTLALTTLYQHWQKNALACTRSRHVTPEGVQACTLGDSYSDIQLTRGCSVQSLLDLQKKIETFVTNTGGELPALMGSDDDIELVWAGPPLAGESDSLPFPWQETEFTRDNDDPGRKKLELTEGSHITLESHNSSFAISQFVNIDLQKTNPHKYLNWSWRVEEHPDDSDVFLSDRDNQAIQLLVGFLDLDDKQWYLNYVWNPVELIDGQPKTCARYVGYEGARVPLHYIVAEAGEKDGWRHQKRDLVADVNMLIRNNVGHFSGEDVEIKQIIGVVVQANTQYEKKKSRASIGKIVFSRD